MKKEQIVTLVGVDAEGNETEDKSLIDRFKGFVVAGYEVTLRLAGKCVEVSTVKGKYILTPHPNQNYYWNQNPRKKSKTPKMHCHLKDNTAELRFWAEPLNNTEGGE